MKTGPGAWFVQTGCFVCHSISVFKVRSRRKSGRTSRRRLRTSSRASGATLDDFIREPTGTMAVVLSRQIILTPEQKQVAVAKLREAFAEHQRQKAAGTAQPRRPLTIELAR